MTDYIAQEPKIDLPFQAYTENGKNRFAHLINTIADNSPTGRAVLEDAAKAGYQLKMQAMSGTQGFVCEELKTIFLSTCYDDNVLMETLAHECRHVQQVMRGVPDNHRELVIRDTVKMNRAIEADAEAVGAATAWEIRKNSGNDGPWKALEEKCPKITQGMESAAKGDERIATPAMMRGAFDGWYQNKPMMDIYEKNVVFNDALSNSLQEHREAKPADFFKREMSSAEMVNMFCKDTAGKCYWADNPDVLNEPARLQINQNTMDFAKSVNEFRADKKLKVDTSYNDLYVYGTASKTAGKSANSAALQAAVARKKLSR